MTWNFSLPFYTSDMLKMPQNVILVLQTINLVIKITVNEELKSQKLTSFLILSFLRSSSSVDTTVKDFS